MKDYQLTPNEQKVLDILQLREAKTARHIVAETSIFDMRVTDILNSLKSKGLAIYHSDGRPHYWVSV